MASLSVSPAALEGTSSLFSPVCDLVLEAHGFDSPPSGHPSALMGSGATKQEVVILPLFAHSRVDRLCPVLCLHALHSSHAHR